MTHVDDEDTKIFTFISDEETCSPFSKDLPEIAMKHESYDVGLKLEGINEPVADFRSKRS